MAEKEKATGMLMNKIIQHGLVDDQGLKPEIQDIFDLLGLKVLKVIRKNGEAFTKGGDSVLLAGPPERMDALRKIFPKGFVFSNHSQMEE